MSRYILDVNSDIAKSIVVFGMVGERGISTVFKIDELEQLTADYINEHFGDLQDDAYDKGFEKGKDVRIKGCEGCMYQDTTIEHNPCNLCCNAFLNRWTAKDDKIEVGDEVADKDGDKTIVTNIHGDLFDGLCSDGSTMTDLFLDDNHKTGRHFDIAKILEAMKHD